jgi:hypothetical protein
VRFVGQAHTPVRSYRVESVGNSKRQRTIVVELPSPEPRVAEMINAITRRTATPITAHMAGVGAQEVVLDVVVVVVVVFGFVA